MDDIIGTVRRHIGRRHKISRYEMADILLDLDIDLVENSTITGRTTDGSLYIGGAVVKGDRESERRATACAWANMCHGITTVSVCYHGTEHGHGVRYDQPGSMHPMHHCPLMFVPKELADHEYDQIGQLRRKADRLLVVSGAELRDPPVPPAPVQVPSWILRLRRHSRVDGTWARIHDDGVLEMRDPNDAQSSDPADKPRHQYRVTAEGDIVKRRLPPESAGDAWKDIGVPEWEYAQTPPMDDLLYAWWEEQVV